MSTSLQRQVVCTQAQLAKELGVSQVTVYKSLSGHPKVSPETRAKVVSLAQSRGYRTNASARAMRQKRFGAIALLQSSEPVRSVLFKQSLAAIQVATREHRLHLLLSELPDDQLTNSGYVPKILKEWMCDGLLLNYISAVPQRMVDLIEQFRLPSVWMNVKHSNNCVHPDDLAGSRTATEHLLKLGHRRIAYVDYVFSGFASNPLHYSAVDRQAGYIEAMADAGLQPRLIRLPADVKRDQSIGYTSSWLDATDRPTAVVTYNADTAKPIVFAAMAVARLSVPKDLSVVTFHDRVQDEFGFRIPTMVLPAQEMGEQAVEMLINCIADPASHFPARALALRLESGDACVSPA